MSTIQERVVARFAATSFRKGDKVVGTKSKWRGLKGVIVSVEKDDVDRDVIAVKWEGEKTAGPAPASALRKS